MRLVPAVLEVTLAVDLDVLPGELLADPAEARVRDHLDGLLALPKLDLLFEEHVDAKGDRAGWGHGLFGRGARARVSDVQRQLRHTT